MEGGGAELQHLSTGKLEGSLPALSCTIVLYLLEEGTGLILGGREVHTQSLGVTRVGARPSLTSPSRRPQVYYQDRRQ